MGWRSGQAYSQDLRERVVAAVDDGLPVYQAAPLFRVSVSYIYKALARRSATGGTGALPRGGGIAPRLAAHEEAVRRCMGERPGTTIAQLRAWLLCERGVSASYGAVWATLARLGLTHKKTAPRGRTGPARCCRGAGALAGAPADPGPGALGVHR